MRRRVRFTAGALLALGLCAFAAPPAIDLAGQPSGCDPSTSEGAPNGVVAPVVTPDHVVSVLTAQMWADDLTGLESAECVTGGVVSIRALLPRLAAFTTVPGDVETAFAELESDLRDGSVSAPAAGPIIRDLVDRLEIDVLGSV